MKNILDLTNNLSIGYNNAINDQFSAICSPLFESFPITSFFYIRLFNNGSCLYLCNNKKWVEYYIQNSFQDDPIHLKSYSPSDVGYSLWSGFKRDNVYSAIYDFNIWNGFNIYEKQSDNSLVIYAFGSNPLNEEMNNFYINNIDVLKSFILYFKQKSSFINDVDDYKLIISKSLPSQDFLTEHNNIEEFYKKIKPSQVAFNEEHNDVFLTNSEVKCLYQLTTGKTAKEIGKSLGLSHRTVEYYLSNIKMKTGLRTKADLIQSALKNSSFCLWDITNKRFS